MALLRMKTTGQIQTATKASAGKVDSCGRKKEGEGKEQW